DQDIPNFMIKLIKKSKIPYQDIQDSQEIKNLIISLKQEFDIDIYITNKHYKLWRSDGIIKKFRDNFYQAYEKFQECIKIREEDLTNSNLRVRLEKLKKTKQDFQDMINNYSFIKTNKYQTIKINLQIYIKFIDLEIELIEKNENKVKFKVKKEISKIQFQISEVYTDNQLPLVMKQLGNDQNRQYYIEQQMREISILSTIPQNEFIIKYHNHQIEKLNICLQMLQAFQYLHQLNVIHGDIKLENILISSQNGAKQVKIIDFKESGFMIEETLGFTPGYEEKNNYNSKYKDKISIGVKLMKFFFYELFKYICDCKKRGEKKECKQSTLHKKQMKERYKKELQKNRTEQKDIFYKQIWSLFNDQPYLRCSLTELIYLSMDMFIKNNKRQQLAQL
ncbi:hypothetical protein ABPG72_006515, partial [Tetrahymena utriculariae]